MKTKKLYILIGILLIIAIILFFIWLKFNAPYESYKIYSISGKVLSEHNDPGDRPTFVRIYEPYYLPRYLCRESEIDIREIRWANEQEGSFSFSIKLPISMKEVILTTECSQCNYEIINLNDIPAEISLVTGNSKCEERDEIGDVPTQVAQIAENLINSIRTDLIEEPLNVSLDEDVRSDMEQSSRYIDDSRRYSYEENLENAYYAQWFAERSRYKLDFYYFERCLQNIEEVLSDKENNQCYRPDFNSYEKYLSLNKTYYGDKNGRMFDDSPFGKENNTELKRDVKYVRDQWKKISDASRECSEIESRIEDTFDFQKPYCEILRTINLIELILWAIILIYVGIIIEKIRKNGKRS